MSDFDPAAVEAGIEGLSGIDWASALTAFRTANVQGMLTTSEQLADLLSKFVPDAIYAEDALMVVGFLVDMQKAGWIAPADPQTDQSMINAVGHGGVGRDHT